jgi:predicted nucleotide-binding protein
LQIGQDSNVIEELIDQLRTSALKLRDCATPGLPTEDAAKMDALREAATDVAESWSGSCLGYHSKVYYNNFEVPPPGAHFSSEWGFNGMFQGTTGEWRECVYDQVVNIINSRAGSPDLSNARALSLVARDFFEETKADVLSILTAAQSAYSDDLIEQLKQAASAVITITRDQAIRAQMPSIGTMSRDSLAVNQGRMSAPHFEVLADVVSLKRPFTVCLELAIIVERAANHLSRLGMQPSRLTSGNRGSKVFIGHGQSPLWRELKDFISDRLQLQWEEFNRVPVAGITNIDRLVQMLDDVGIALLVLTAEDERIGGAFVARQNVIHELGLFQGRLGFTRAIVLLEDGCEEFSNIHGLGQIRFPVGQISAKFEEIRAVLEREGFHQS